MHSFKGKSSIIHFNYDFSGQLLIANNNNEIVTIDAQDILDFVANEYIRPRLLSEIEDMDSRDLLKGIVTKK